MRLNFDPEIVLRMAISGIKGGEGNKSGDRPTGGPRYLRHLGKLTSLRLGLEMLKAGNSVKKLVWRLFLVSSWCGQNPGPGEKTSFLLQQPPPPPPLSQTTSLCITIYPTLFHIISTLTITTICLILRFPSKKREEVQK